MKEESSIPVAEGAEGGVISVFVPAEVVAATVGAGDVIGEVVGGVTAVAGGFAAISCGVIAFPSEAM